MLVNDSISYVPCHRAVTTLFLPITVRLALSVFLAFSSHSTLLADASSSTTSGVATSDATINRLRQLFFAGLENEGAADDGLHLAAGLAATPQASSLERGYHGAFLALAAKHSLFPLRKLRLTKESLAILDSVLAAAPHDIESRILRASIMVAIPSFFGRNEQGISELKLLAEELSHKANLLPCSVTLLATNLILDNARDGAISLTTDEQASLTGERRLCAPAPSVVTPSEAQ